MSVDTGLIRGMNPYAEESEVQILPKFILTFMFIEGITLQLPFTSAETANKVLDNLNGKTGTCVIQSYEPIASLIDLDRLICITPSDFKKEGQ